MKYNKIFKTYLFKLLKDCEDLRIIKDEMEILYLDDIGADNFSIEQSNNFIIIDYTDPDGEDDYDYQSYSLDIGNVVSIKILPNHYNESFTLEIYLYNEIIEDELP